VTAAIEGIPAHCASMITLRTTSVPAASAIVARWQHRPIVATPIDAEIILIG